MQAAKKRVIKRLMRPTLYDHIVAAFAAAAAWWAARKNPKHRGTPGIKEKGDIEKGVRGKGGGSHGGDEDEDEAGLAGAAGPDAEDDSDEDAAQRKTANGKAEMGRLRASSSRGSRGEKGLSEAETEADRREPPDSDDD